MEGDNRQNTAGVETPLRCQHRLPDFIQFLIDLNPDRLKGAGRGVDLAGLRPRHHCPDDLRQLQGAGDGRILAGLADGAGDPPCRPLFTIITKHAFKPLGAGRVDEITGIRAGFFHPHIERPVMPKRKATLSRIDLGGG